MSGSRRKWLTRAFKEAHGRPPYHAKFRGGVQVQQNELRRAKKDWLATRRGRP